MRTAGPTRQPSIRVLWFGQVLPVLAVTCCAAGCLSPTKQRKQADETAARIIERQQTAALGRTEPFTIEPPADTLRRRLLVDQNLPRKGRASLGTDQLRPVKHWPEEPAAAATARSTTRPAGTNRKTIRLTLLDALQVAAANNRDYQSRKEDIFREALDLDLESNDFRNTFAGILDGTIRHDESGSSPVGAGAGGAETSVTRTLKTGATLTARIGVDLVRLLTDHRPSSTGVFADTSVSIPLLRGAGRHIVTEPLTQAQRNVVYAIHTFERYKRTLAVRVADGYLGVLEQLDQIKNAEQNLKNLRVSTGRVQALASHGRLAPDKVDQAKQDELLARDRVIRAKETYQSRLDGLKLTLGLPTDARIKLDPQELQRLADEAGDALKTAEKTPASGPASQPTTASAPRRAGRFELPEAKAIATALASRLDLRTSVGRVGDAQRGVVVAADGLKPDLSLTGSASMGGSRSVSSGASPNARLRPERGVYSGGVSTDLPWERTAERNAYRDAFISLERAVRNMQEQEDQVKRQVRDALRTLRRTGETYKIQAKAVRLAERRVEHQRLLLGLGEALIRDVLEAQEDLLSAQNSRTAALVDYRIAELNLQRDMGVLAVDEKGRWREYQPGRKE